MSTLLRCVVIFGKWAFFAGLIAVVIFLAIPNDSVASAIAIVAAGLLIGLLAGSPTLQHARDGFTESTRWLKDRLLMMLVSGSAGLAANSVTDSLDDHWKWFDQFKQSLAQTSTSLANLSNQAEFGDHWIFIAVAGGVWGLLVTLNSEFEAKKPT